MGVATILRESMMIFPSFPEEAGKTTSGIGIEVELHLQV